MFRDKGKWSHPGWIEPDGKGKGSKWVPGSSGKTPGYKHLSYQSNTWSAKRKATRPSASFAGQKACAARAARAAQPSNAASTGPNGTCNATKASEKPPIFGLVQRTGEAVIRLLDNVQQETIKPLILQTIAPGAIVNTDEYAIYARLPEWGFEHKTVNHSQGEYARDEDGDGFHEVHVNTMEGLWSLLRSWLRPHRGISQDKLPLYLAFFEFVYNLKRRGKRLLSSLLGVLLKKIPKPI